MTSTLLLGLIAALAWGIHDVFVRFISRRAAILPTLLTVLVMGGIITSPFGIIWGDWAAMTGIAYMLAIMGGIAFAFASYSLYQAFVIGPVRLVSPLIASYPVLSVAWASLSGVDVVLGEWIAVLIIIAGIAIVASGVDEDADAGDVSLQEAAAARRRAIIWSLCAAAGFAATFWAGQTAAHIGADLPVIIITRGAAIAAVAAGLIIKHGIGRPQIALNGNLLLLFAMGGLDALALGAVTISGTLPHPEYASVTSSVFGLVTVVLAWLFLRERMAPRQWSGVLIVFAAIAYLGL